jgi:hypothetical protein
VVVVIPDGRGGQAPVSHLRIAALPFDPDSARARMAVQSGLRPIDSGRFDSLRVAFGGPFEAWQAASGALIAARGTGDTSAPRALYDRARARLDSASLTVLPALASEAVRIATRDKDMHPGWDSLLGRASRGRPGERLVDTTDVAGVAHLVLARGDYWLWAETPDPADPFLAWQWSVPVTGNSVQLTPLNGRRVPRMP